MKILIVDDEPDLIELVRLRLESSGYDVLEAHDGQEGLDMARKDHPDLIILDIMMPKMNGYQVCRELKKEDKKTPVMLLTAKSQESDRFWGKECGADSFVTKPFEMDHLLSTIQGLLNPSKKPQ